MQPGDVAIVTAGATGLGQIIAHELASRGVHVVIGDVDAAAGRSTAEEIGSAGGRATAIEADVTDDEDLGQLVDAASRVGPLRALVNNAGGWGRGSHYPDGSAADWSRVLDLNLRAPMLATQLALPVMQRAGGGAVVNISSSGGLGPDPYGSPEYAAAKAGLIRFTSAVQHLAEAVGVRVNCVVPGWIGLPRARIEFAELSEVEQAEAGGLIAPHLVVDEVARLVEDEQAVAQIVGIRHDRAPYLLEPSAIDPHWS